MNNNYKAIVIGAGPAGLGAALALSRAGIEVDIYERQKEIGLQRRGETIRFSPEMEALLGKGFFESQTIHKINKRRYYSHSGKKLVDRTISEYNLIIDWQCFIRAIAAVVEKSGARINTGTAVEGIVIEKGRARMVRLSGRDCPADLVYSCGGIDDLSSILAGIDRSRLDRPAAKWILKNYGGPEDRLEYHFHAEDGRLAVGCIFPRGKGEAEIIILSLSNNWLPELEEFSSFHKIFSERINGATVEYSLRTSIPMGGMITECMPAKGLFTAGDALGHVQARGGSGIRTSFLISNACGVAGANALRYGNWDRVPEIIRKNSHMKSLRIHNLIFSELRMLMFRPAATEQGMDILWPAISAALR
ncbi:MAG TPA: FAD-dependent monooxygenase [Desulfomonilia bacterium]